MARPKKKEVLSDDTLPGMDLRPNCRGELVPVSSNTLALTPDKLSDSLSAALHQPSEVYEGMTKMEVIAKELVSQAETGELKAIDMVFDRVVGKPKQTSVNFNANATGTFSSFLKSLQDSSEQNVSCESPIDVELEESSEEKVRNLF